MIPRERKHWVDLLKGFCMMAILYYHAEYYYTDRHLIPYHFYVSNVLMAFFFMSGYLYFEEGRQVFSLSRKLRSIFRGIIIPYFIFTLLIAFPKAYVHGRSMNVGEMLLHIVMGQASWFVAALSVASVLFSVLLYFTRQRTALMAVVGCGAYAVSAFLHHSHLAVEPNVWYVNEALLALFYLYAGYFFHANEARLNFLLRLPALILYLIIYIGCKFLESHFGLTITVAPMIISSFALFLIDTLATILLLMGVARRLGRCHLVEWTGAHSLVYYFICGGVPLLSALLFRRIGLPYDGSYLRVVLLFSVVYAFATLLTWLIYRFFPFLVGQKMKGNKQ